ncbi:MAG: hypothetical protein ABL931_13325 [Usitatibacteraceae bacterium]
MATISSQEATGADEARTFQLWVLSDAHVATDKAVAAAIRNGMKFIAPAGYPESLANALRQSEEGGDLGGPPIVRLGHFPELAELDAARLLAVFELRNPLVGDAKARSQHLLRHPQSGANGGTLTLRRLRRLAQRSHSRQLPVYGLASRSEVAIKAHGHTFH